MTGAGTRTSPVLNFAKFNFRQIACLEVLLVPGRHICTTLSKLMEAGLISPQLLLFAVHGQWPG